MNLLTLHCRPRTSLFRVLTASTALAWVSSYKLVTEQFCTFARYCVRFRSDVSQRQRSYCKAFIRGNKAVNYFAARALSVCWHYCWYGHYRGYYYRRSLGCMVCQAFLHRRLCSFLAVLVRLRRTFPSYINVSNLLIDVVSVLGMLLSPLPVQSTY